MNESLDRAFLKIKHVRDAVVGYVLVKEDHATKYYTIFVISHIIFAMFIWSYLRVLYSEPGEVPQVRLQTRTSFIC